MNDLCTSFDGHIALLVCGAAMFLVQVPLLISKARRQGFIRAMREGQYVMTWLRESMSAKEFLAYNVAIAIVSGCMMGVMVIDGYCR